MDIKTVKNWEEIGKIAKKMQEHIAIAQTEIQKQIKISEDNLKELEKNNEQV